MAWRLLGLALSALAGLPALAMDATPAQAGPNLPAASSALPWPEVGACALVALNGDGRVRVDGTPCGTLEAVASALAVRAGRAGRESDGASSLRVLLTAEADVPFRAVLWILQASADPRVKAHRIRFAVRHRSSGELGVLPLPLPRDRGPETQRTVAGGTLVRVTAGAAQGAAGTEPERLYATLVSLPVEQRRALTVTLALGNGGAAVAHGYAVSLIDAFHRAEVRNVLLAGDPAPPKGGDDLGAAIRQLGKAGASGAILEWAGPGPGLAPTGMPLPISPAPSALPPPPTDAERRIRALEHRVAELEARLANKAPPPPPAEDPALLEDWDVGAVPGSLAENPPPPAAHPGRAPEVGIELTAGASVLLDNRAYSIADRDAAVAERAREALRDRLRELTKDPATRDPDGSSRRIIVFLGSRQANWGLAEVVERICEDPAIRIRVFQRSLDREEGR